jgi:hypothetical protein
MKKEMKPREEYDKWDTDDQYESSELLNVKYSQEDIKYLEGPEVEYIGNIIETVDVSS